MQDCDITENNFTKIILTGDFPLLSCVAISLVKNTQKTCSNFEVLRQMYGNLSIHKVCWHNSFHSLCFFYDVLICLQHILDHVIDLMAKNLFFFPYCSLLGKFVHFFQYSLDHVIDLMDRNIFCFSISRYIYWVGPINRKNTDITGSSLIIHCLQIWLTHI